MANSGRLDRWLTQSSPSTPSTPGSNGALEFQAEGGAIDVTAAAVSTPGELRWTSRSRSSSRSNSICPPQAGSNGQPRLARRPTRSVRRRGGSLAGRSCPPWRQLPEALVARLAAPPQAQAAIVARQQRVAGHVAVLPVQAGTDVAARIERGGGRGPWLRPLQPAPRPRLP